MILKLSAPLPAFSFETGSRTDRVPGQQLEVLHVGRVASVLRDQKAFGEGRPEIAERDFDAIGIAGAVDRAAPEALGLLSVRVSVCIAVRPENVVRA
ncbi:hypothetical protein GCM10011494_04520 [Novosphingobium endophyticum]|uniref:Uncharacterized protein n=1 Tax=Novosphingobium endophyticum TaxID=1955250 RepID=A0A916TPZ5_9SPHN|nr:hypothetical protein GCM10011494_04520 [Novosphingobium endophyticum]